MTSYPPKGPLLLILLALAGCDSADHTARPFAARNTGMTVTDRNRILAWLECEECVDEELKGVALLGKKEVAAVDSLGEDLLGGPSATRRSNVRQQIESSYEEDSVYAVSTGSQLPETKSKYVDHYLGNYINTYRIRAARALVEIGGTRAAAILDSAASGFVRTPGDSLRADAKLKLLFFRDSISPLAPGTVDSAP